jgi:hypothetical protein
VESLPIGNSDYTRLALVLPGVTQNSNFAFAQYTINGSRAIERVCVSVLSGFPDPLLELNDRIDDRALGMGSVGLVHRS